MRSRDLEDCHSGAHRYRRLILHCHIARRRIGLQDVRQVNLAFVEEIETRVDKFRETGDFAYLDVYVGKWGLGLILAALAEFVEGAREHLEMTDDQLNDNEHISLLLKQAALAAGDSLMLESACDDCPRKE